MGSRPISRNAATTVPLEPEHKLTVSGGFEKDEKLAQMFQEHDRFESVKALCTSILTGMLYVPSVLGC